MAGYTYFVLLLAFVYQNFGGETVMLYESHTNERGMIGQVINLIPLLYFHLCLSFCLIVYLSVNI